MQCRMHHVHIFATDIDKSIAFYTDYFGGEIVLDTEMAGARNVFMKIGDGRLHFYDQSPKDSFRGPIHHLGIQTDDLENLVKKMKAGGIAFRKPISDFGVWKYVMAAGPDDVLLDLFQVDEEKMPEEIKSYF